MDVMEYVKKIVDSIGGDKAQIASFVADPAKLIKAIIGIDVSDDMLKAIINGVKGQLKDQIPADAFAGILGAAGDAAAKESKGGILDAIKKIF